MAVIRAIASDHSHRSGWAAILGAGLIWGSSYLFIAEGLTAMAPEGITFFRTVVGTIALGLIPAARKPLPRRDLRRARLLGATWIAIPMSMFPFAEQHVSSALTGLMNAAIPIVATLVAAVIARTLPNRRTGAALAVGTFGGALIALPNLSEGRSTTWGLALIVVAMFFYGVSLNIAGPLQRRNGAAPVVWRAVSTAALLTAPTGFRAVLDARWNPAALVSLLLLGALGTGVANTLAARAAGSLSPSQASSIGYIIPTVSLILGVTVRHEHVAFVSIIGGVVCMAGAWMLARASSTVPTPPFPPPSADPRPTASS